MLEFDKQAVGQAIRRLRKERGLSQEVVSSFAGLARSHLAIKMGTSSRILKRFGVWPMPLGYILMNWSNSLKRNGFAALHKI